MNTTLSPVPTPQSQCSFHNESHTRWNQPCWKFAFNKLLKKVTDVQVGLLTWAFCSLSSASLALSATLASSSASCFRLFSLRSSSSSSLNASRWLIMGTLTTEWRKSTRLNRAKQRRACTGWSKESYLLAHLTHSHACSLHLVLCILLSSVSGQ